MIPTKFWFERKLTGKVRPRITESDWHRKALVLMQVEVEGEYGFLKGSTSNTVQCYWRDATPDDICSLVSVNL